MGVINCGELSRLFLHLLQCKSHLLFDPSVFLPSLTISCFVYSFLVLRAAVSRLPVNLPDPSVFLPSLTISCFVYSFLVLLRHLRAAVSRLPVNLPDPSVFLPSLVLSIAFLSLSVTSALQ